MNEHIKRNEWIAAALLGCCATALPAQAASFDCAKAWAKVEKISSDAAKDEKTHTCRGAA